MNKAFKIIHLTNLILALIVIYTLVYYHGIAFSEDTFISHTILLNVATFIFSLNFMLVGLLKRNFIKHTKSRWIESLLYSSIVVNVIFQLLTGKSLIALVLDTESTITLFYHLSLLLIVGFELGNQAAKSKIWQIPLGLLFLLSFLVLIIAGTSILLLPEMTNNGHILSFTDALFTSTSAVCVTGLIVVDTATFFSIKGQLVILTLIQIGGLNIIFFATYFIRYLHGKIKKTNEIETSKVFTQIENPSQAANLLSNILFISLSIEFIGTIILFYQWDYNLFDNYGQKLYYSIFHSISAFNNAGFSLFTNNLEAIPYASNIHLSIAFLIIIGGLGFHTIEDVKNLIFQKSKTIDINSKIAIIGSIMLITIGFGCFYFGGLQTNIDQQSPIISIFFQTVTTRTAGFNTISIEQLSLGVYVLFILLMFIGTASGSTGGGIKISTIFVFFKSLISPRFYKEHTPLFKKSSLIIVTALSLILVGSMFLYLFHPEIPFQKLLFEEVSAISTVGLSMGITDDLNNFGKYIVMITILLGRLGPITLGYLVTNNKFFSQSHSITVG